MPQPRIFFGGNSGGGGPTSLIVQDEGIVVVGAATTLNFVGAGVTVTPGAPNTADVTIPGGGGGGGYNNVEYRSLTALEIAAKQITLAALPSLPLLALVDLVGGSPQQRVVDFTIAGNILSWNGLGLDGVLVETDVLRIAYNS